MTDIPAEQPIETLSPAAAAARLVALSTAYQSEQQSAPDLSPEAATQRLAEMTKLYRDSTRPRNSEADAALVGEQAPREFETTSWPQVSTRDKLSTVELLRHVGIPDKGIEGALVGREFTEQDVQAAREWKHRAETDPELRNLILSGDHSARHVLVAMSIILAAGAGGKE